ncbi:unnamed protein product [Heterotrigona itama]|uniref:Uncharacterized protein n=1 Tax=Heterotrigona itama TaxID=395501 RepID=A0A6V7H708_9HYME|nr:unnamed protein product [Heterotrigona itama]
MLESYETAGYNAYMRIVKQGRRSNRVKAKVKRPINVPGRADKLHNSKIPVAFLYFPFSYSICAMSCNLYNRLGILIDFQSTMYNFFVKLINFLYERVELNIKIIILNNKLKVSNTNLISLK